MSNVGTSDSELNDDRSDRLQRRNGQRQLENAWKSAADGETKDHVFRRGNTLSYNKASNLIYEVRMPSDDLERSGVRACEQRI
jgi:hypothetical protein